MKRRILGRRAGWASLEGRVVVAIRSGCGCEVCVVGSTNKTRRAKSVAQASCFSVEFEMQRPSEKECSRPRTPLWLQTPRGGDTSGSRLESILQEPWVSASVRRLPCKPHRRVSSHGCWLCSIMATPRSGYVEETDTLGAFLDRNSSFDTKSKSMRVCICHPHPSTQRSAKYAIKHHPPLPVSLTRPDKTS